MNNLNVLGFGYCKGWRHIPHNFCQFFRNFRSAWERATKGYCQSDLIDLDCHYMTLIENSLREFARNEKWHPEDCSFEEWNAKLKAIVEFFHRGNPAVDVPNVFIKEWMDSANDEDPSVHREAADAMYAEDCRLERERKRAQYLAFSHLSEVIDRLWL